MPGVLRGQQGGLWSWSRGKYLLSMYYEAGPALGPRNVTGMKGDKDKYLCLLELIPGEVMGQMSNDH